MRNSIVRGSAPADAACIHCAAPDAQHAQGWQARCDVILVPSQLRTFRADLDWLRGMYGDAPEVVRSLQTSNAHWELIVWQSRSRRRHNRSVCNLPISTDVLPALSAAQCCHVHTSASGPSLYAPHHARAFAASQHEADEEVAGSSDPDRIAELLKDRIAASEMSAAETETDISLAEEELDMLVRSHASSSPNRFVRHISVVAYHFLCWNTG